MDSAVPLPAPVVEAGRRLPRPRAWKVAAWGCSLLLTACAGGPSSSAGPDGPARASGKVEIFGTIDAGMGHAR